MKIFEEKGYRYQQHLKSGGEGEIHLIKNVDKLFVAKIFPRMEQSTFELLSDISTMQIPNIPKIYELFNFEDKTVIIRDYIEGQTLYDYMQESGPLDYMQAKSIILRICETLKFFHNLEPNPIIYRDLKPENIIITPNNEIRLIDFGIARYYKKEATRDTILAGTKGYTAPEVLAGMQSDNRSDIYSIGVLFYELLTGKNLLEPPFQIRPVKESNNNLEKWLDTVIAKATDFNQTMRYDKIEDFVYDLEHPHKIGRKKRITCFAAIVLIVLLIGALIAVGLSVFKPNEKEPIEEPAAEEHVPAFTLDFDSEDDADYVIGYEDLGSEFLIEDGALSITKDVCTIDYPIANGMVIHYKVKASDGTAVSLGPYKILGSSLFEFTYFDNKTGKDYLAWDVPLAKGKLQMEHNYVDVIMYTTQDNDAFYAVLIDEENKMTAYTAYQIPKIFTDINYLDVINYNLMDDDFIYIDQVIVDNIDIDTYIKRYFNDYAKENGEFANLFQTDIDELPVIPME